MSERATAADLQLDACLREVFGEAPAPGLAERIALRMRSGPDAAAHSGWRGRLLAAALLLGGGAAVAGVAWLRHEEQNRAAAPSPQEPQGKDASPKKQQRLDQNAALVNVVADALRDLAHADRRDDVLAVLTVLGGEGRVDELLDLLRRLAKSLGVDEAVTQTAVDTVQSGAALNTHPPSREQIVRWLRDLDKPSKAAEARAALVQACEYAQATVSEALQQEERAVLGRPALARELESLAGDLRVRRLALDRARTRLFPVAHVPTGNTLIADYSDNRVIEVDRDGRIVWEIDDIYGAWDARLLQNGNLLLTEFSVSRVSEVDRKGNRVWVYEDLKNPYRASRLANGNTFIADTFGGRVIEVTPEKQIVWKYDAQIRPFGAERLASGNTLIADLLQDRVLEVDPQGAIVWQVGNMNNVHDAKRLPNGNTLITLRSPGAVLEVDRDGTVVWKLEKLKSPSSAERLPNGNTLVAENTAVREFDPQGAVVWKQQMTWAVSARRY